MTPILAGPAVLRRRWWAVVVAAGGAVAAVYLPHVLAVGSKVVGFLPGYLQQEGYNSGQRFAIIALFTTGHLAIAIAVLILAVTGLAVLRFSDPDHPWRGAVVMTGAALAVTTPDYQWYAILLVMLVVLDGRPEWLAFAAGGYLAAEPHLGRWRVIHHPQAVGYGLAALFVALVWIVRVVIARYPRLVTAEAASDPRGHVSAVRVLSPADAAVDAPVGAAAPAGNELVGAMSSAGAPAGAATADGTEAAGTGGGATTTSIGGTAAAGLAAPAPLPRRKRPTAGVGTDGRVVNAPRLHEIIPSITRK
jgi:hypothetical protein